MRRTLHGHAQRGGEFPGGGDGQVAHPAAAHVGGVGVRRSGRGRRAAPRSSPHRRRRPRRRAPARGPRRSSWRVGSGRRRRRSGSARARRPRRRPASARPSAAACASTGVAADNASAAAVAYRSARGAGTRCAAVSSASAIDDAPDGVAPSSGSAGRTISCSASSAVSNHRPGCSGSAKCSSAVSSSPVAASSHCGFAGDLVQRQQPGRQRRVVLEDRGAVADAPAEAGAPQPAVDDVQVEQRARASSLRRRAIRDRRARRSPRRAR